MSKISDFGDENTLSSLNNLMLHYDNFMTFLKMSIFLYLSSLITVAPSPSWLNWTITTIPPWNIAFFLTGSIAIVIDRMIRKDLHAYIYIYIYWVPSPRPRGETVSQQPEKNEIYFAPSASSSRSSANSWSWRARKEENKEIISCVDVNFVFMTCKMNVCETIA